MLVSIVGGLNFRFSLYVPPDHSSVWATVFAAVHGTETQLLKYTVSPNYISRLREKKRCQIEGASIFKVWYQRWTLLKLGDFF